MSIPTIQICSECPTELTPLQVRRGNVTCGRTCGAARHRRLGERLERYRQRRAALEQALGSHVTTDVTVPMVPLSVAVDVAMESDRDGWLRGYDARLHQERRAS